MLQVEEWARLAWCLELDEYEMETIQLELTTYFNSTIFHIPTL